MEAMRAVTAQWATCLLVTIMCLNALVGMTYSEVNEPLKDDGADLQDVPHRDRESLDEVQPPGHLKPLGSHRPPEMPGVDVLERVPDPPDFFSRYVEAGRPVVFKGAAKEMASYRLWTDEYLSGRYGDLIVEVEEGKKENRSKDLWRMPLSKFIKSYRQEDVYLVTDVPEEMGDDFCLLRCLLCGGFTDVLVDTILWYSSGGTKSVLHFDSLDNINCVMDGRKDIFLVDKREKDNVHIDHPEGSFSGVDVDRVDFQKYPGLAKVPWYNVTLERGDCLFIPYRWFHSVRSSGRNLAINVWFVHQVWFNSSDCPGDFSQLPDYLPLSKVTTRGNRLEPLRSDIAVEIQSNEGSISLAQLTELDTLFQEPIQEKIPQLFHLLDTDGDGFLTLTELYTNEFFQALASVGFELNEDGELGIQGDEDDDDNDGDDDDDDNNDDDDNDEDDGDDDEEREESRRGEKPEERQGDQMDDIHGKNVGHDGRVEL